MVGLTIAFLATATASSEVEDQKIITGINLTHQLEYEAAIALFDSMISEDRGDPKAYFFKAEVYFWQYVLTDFDDEPGVLFKEISELAIDAAKARLKKDENEQESRLYLGRAYANLGRYLAINGHYLKAYWASRKGEKTLRALVEDDPECYDAYLELGLYDYYTDVAKVLKLLSILLGLEGDRHQGLEYLQRAAEKGELTRVDAQFFLEDIYQRYEEDYEKAAGFGEALVQQYPSNLLFLSQLASINRGLGQFEKAIENCETILENKNHDRFPEILQTARFQIGSCLLSLNRFDAAITAFEQIVTLADEKKETEDWTYPWSLYKIGHCYELKGEREKAVASFRRIKKEPDRSCYKSARSRIKQPLTEFDITMEIAGNLLAQNEYEPALEHYSKILAEIEAGSEGFLPTEKPQVYFRIARTYQEMGDCTKALTAFHHVLSSPVDSPEWLKPWANYRAGNCYAELGIATEADKYYGAAYDSNDRYLRGRIDRDRQDLHQTATPAQQ